MEWLKKISRKLFYIENDIDDEVYYIGGSDTLPAPLSKEEEKDILKILSNGDMSVK